MLLKATIPALAAVFAFSSVGAAMADDGPRRDKQKRERPAAAASAVGAGVTAADRRGAYAGGLAGSTATATRDRQGRLVSPNAAQTNSTGAVYTTRRSAAAAVNTNGSAAGQGVQSTGSTVDAYGETGRNGSNADIYGDSVATSGERPN